MLRLRLASPTALAALTLFLVALGAGLPAAWAQNGIPAGGPPAPTPRVPIAIGGGWSATVAVPPAFFWSGQGAVFANDTYEFDGQGCVSVTDDFDAGDQFRIYDNMTALGDTSSPGMASGEVGPDAAYADPDYSSGTFVLGPGSHSISIEVIVNPFEGGRGYIRIDPPGTSPYCPSAPAVPGAGLAILLALLLLAGTLLMRRFGGSPAVGG